MADKYSQLTSLSVSREEAYLDSSRVAAEARAILSTLAKATISFVDTRIFTTKWPTATHECTHESCNSEQVDFWYPVLFVFGYYYHVRCVYVCLSGELKGSYAQRPWAVRPRVRNWPPRSGYFYTLLAQFEYKEILLEARSTVILFTSSLAQEDILGYSV